ncbi:hypothetical protein HanRHA438_Chr09g0394231 [Helianthus annuus]|nr:hypothetical protein HanRHA438_Chr09g0394231 [Helianthus annuus]
MYFRKVNALHGLEVKEQGIHGRHLLKGSPHIFRPRAKYRCQSLVLQKKKEKKKENYIFSKVIL